jgi:hypothetical protein
MNLTPTRARESVPACGAEDYADYRVLDPQGREIGRVREVFKSADDGFDYVEVGSGFLGLRSALIPVGLVAVDDENEALLLR